MNLVTKTLLTTAIATFLVVVINRLVLGNVDMAQTIKTAVIFAVVFFVISFFIGRR